MVCFLCVVTVVVIYMLHVVSNLNHHTPSVEPRSSLRHGRAGIVWILIGLADQPVALESFNLRRGAHMPISICARPLAFPNFDEPY